MSIHKNKEAQGVFHFEEHVKENEQLNMGFKQDFTTETDRFAQEIEEQRETVVQKVQELSEQEQAQLEHLMSLDEHDEYRDESGKSVPYERKKKFLGTRDETVSEYRERVGGIIKRKYNRMRQEAALPVQSLTEKTDYYQNPNIINKVDVSQVEHSFSANRKDMMKQGLIQMAKSDLGQNFEAEDETATAYRAFLQKVMDYGKLTGEYVSERIGIGTYLDNTEMREKEIDAFMEMRKSLETALQKADGNAHVHKTLEGYKSMLGGIADGNLEVPADAETIEIGGKVVDANGVAAENVIDRKDVPLFAHEPSIEDVDQGGVGDCYLVGSLASMIAIDPQLIKDCMKDNGDGTVTVRLFKPDINLEAEGIEYQSEPVYIKVQKKTLGNKGGRNALWVNIFEMAVNAYRREISLRTDLINKTLYSHLNGDEEEELKAFIKQCDADTSEKMIKKVGKDNVLAAYLTYQWHNLKKIEAFIKTKRYGKLYANILDFKRKQQKEVINADAIQSGISTEMLSALSGGIHLMHKTESRSIREMNDLCYVFDKMPKQKGEEEEETPEKALAKELVREYLKGFSCAEENKYKKDKGSKEPDSYAHYITRAQMTQLVNQAKASYARQATMTEFIGKLDKNSALAKKLNEQKKVNADIEQEITQYADDMIEYFLEKADENTALPYERFSGQYSSDAEKLFEDIREAVDKRKVINAGTFRELGAPETKIGQSFEPTFEGISSKHAYSIIGTKTVVVNGVKIKFVRLRNPWGLNHTVYEKDPETGEIKTKQDLSGVTGGINEVELNHFMERFEFVSISDVKSLKPVKSK